MKIKNLKQKAAKAVLEYIEPGMIIGLGTGTTVNFFIKELAKKIKNGFNISCIPSSISSHNLAISLNIPIVTFDTTLTLDLMVDGADEFDKDLNLIKGGGGALLREKIIAKSSNKMIIIADDSKLVNDLGLFPLPIEILPFGAKSTIYMIKKIIKTLNMTGTFFLRKKNDGNPFITDNGHCIYDCKLKIIKNPKQLAKKLSFIPGIIEHGLFIGFSNLAIIASDNNIKKIEL